jgi:hypothetical protein
MGIGLLRLSIPELEESKRKIAAEVADKPVTHTPVNARLAEQEFLMMLSFIGFPPTNRINALFPDYVEPVSSVDAMWF